MKLEEIFSFENINSAYKNCRKSKQHKGEVIRLETNLSFNLHILNKELVSNKYTFGKYKRFKIYEPKERLIEIKLIYDNCACRKNKGTTFAINRLHKFLRKEYMKENNNNIYFLKCDVRKYFSNIDYEVLLKLLKEINFSEDEMWFIKKIIKGEQNKNEKGFPLAIGLVSGLHYYT